MTLNIAEISAAVEAEANTLSDQGNEEAAGALRELLLKENEETLVKFAQIVRSAKIPTAQP